MSDKLKQNEVKNHNAKRSGMVSYLSRKNFEMSKQIRTYLQENKTELDKENFMLKLDKNISECASYSLYRVGEGATTYIGSHTCSHRNCNICNWMRQKTLRRKYLRFFDKNEELYHLQNFETGKTKTVTEDWYLRKFKDSEKYNLLGKRKYDLMHLTLTVPHFADTGFNGEKYYYRTFIALFNKLRKSNKKVWISDKVRYSWSDLVYGGEYGIETTTGANGLNIHSHSLLFVKKTTGSRNILHKVVLQLWNELTVNEFSKRIQFLPKHLEGIKKGNKALLTDEYILENLNPKGTTTIGLETIYSLQAGKKVRSNEFKSGDMLKAVMETISYHFEPQAFDKKHNEYNLDLLADILPNIHRQRLYGRFGCIEQENSLAYRTKDVKEEYEDIIVDAETGEVIEEHAEHFVIRPYKIFHDKENDNEIKVSKRVLSESIHIEAINTMHALDTMNTMYITQKQGRRYIKEENQTNN